jgi:hypothetical protein
MVSSDHRKPDRHRAEKVRIEAKEAVTSNIPQCVEHLVGQQASVTGSVKVFETLQNQTLNKQLFYDVLELSMYEIFPELAESNAAMHFKSFAT